MLYIFSWNLRKSSVSLSEMQVDDNSQEAIASVFMLHMYGIKAQPSCIASAVKQAY